MSDRRGAARAARGHARRDDPMITLSEEGGVRYLHFGSPWIQGAMRIARPFELEIDYVRDMMAWLLFLAPPARVLQLGLGAGALTKYCWRRFPDTRITAVEVSAAVVACARRDFALPADDARLSVVLADAGEFVARPAARGGYGVIQADLYDRHARAPALDGESFYRSCRRALADPGILVVNLFGEDDACRGSRLALSRAFEGRVLALPPVPAGNVVMLAFKGPMLRVAWPQLAERAHALAAERLPARAWLRALRAQQGHFPDFGI